MRHFRWTVVKVLAEVTLYRVRHNENQADIDQMLTTVALQFGLDGTDVVNIRNYAYKEAFFKEGANESS